MRVIFSSGEAHRRRQYRVYGKAAERSTAEKSELDLDLHAGGKLEAHQSLNGLGGGVGDVDQALVGAALELLTGVLILMNSAQDGDDLLLGGQRDGPETVAPVRLAVSTIFSALWSMT